MPPSAAWKRLELRVCAALGGRRGGPTGASTSDCVNVPWAVEIKRTKRTGPPVLGVWVQQAKRSGMREGRPWLLVIAGHNDRRPTVCMDFLHFVEIARAAGLIAEPEEVEAEATA